MTEIVEYIYVVPTEWFGKNIQTDLNQAIVFENKGIRIITSVEKDIASVETLFISLLTIHDLECPLSIEDIPLDMKHVLQNTMFECVYIKLVPEINSIQIYSNLTTHAFKYKKNIVIQRDKPYNLDRELRTTHESYITADRLLECIIHVKHSHSVSLHTSKSNNNFFLSGYDEENNKIWTYIQEKCKWTPGEGATRIHAKYFYIILGIIKNKIKFSNMLKIKMTDSNILILVLLLNDGTHMKSIIAPMIQSGGLDVSNEDLPSTN